MTAGARLRVRGVAGERGGRSSATDLCLLAVARSALGEEGPAREALRAGPDPRWRAEAEVAVRALGPVR